MKALFFLLVVVNLLVFGWEYHRQQQPMKRDLQRELPTGVKRLQLLSEQDPPNRGGVAETDESLADPGGAEHSPLIHEPDRVSLTTDEQDAPRPPEEPVVESAPELVEAQEQMQQPEQEPTLISAIEPDSETDLSSWFSQEPPDNDAVEPEPESQAGLMSDAPTEPNPAEPGLSPWHCFAFGPFNKQNEAEDVADRLDVLVVDIQGREEIREKQVGYWVLIPTQRSRQAARRKVQELLDAGIKDVWRFSKGDLANSISLGLFSNRAPAERHRQAVRRKGFAAEVRPRIIDETSYWLDFRSTDVQGLPTDLLQELVRDYSGTKLSTRACPADAVI